MICRNNERDLDVDNGTRGTVRHVHAGGVVIETDARLDPGAARRATSPSTSSTPTR